VGWPVLLVVTGAVSPGPALVGATGLAVLNTGAGVLIYQGILRAAGSCGAHWPHGGAPDAAGPRTIPYETAATCLRLITSAGVVLADTVAPQGSGPSAHGAVTAGAAVRQR
jgi:hypothetical protein